MSAPLTLRALNRATLARRMLLERKKSPPLQVIEQLVGMQAQLPRPPDIGIWSRSQGFRSEDLTKLVNTRKAVRRIKARCLSQVVISPRSVLQVRAIFRRGPVYRGRRRARRSRPCVRN